ncbi:Ral GTPase-activating protein subunit alpha-1, partial [Modicella reniformis]
SGDVGYDELIHGSPTGLSKDFTRFLDCLGWPIQVETHSGYLGQLGKDICETTPYYADRNTEVIFHVPYLMRPPGPDVPLIRDHQLITHFRSVISTDQVAVVWMEERERMSNLLPLIDQGVIVYILIHPLGGDSAGGLFWIRIMIPNTHTNAGMARLTANPLMIGPLADGMLVSRHALGNLVRNTAISADKACRQVMDSYTEPSATRARYIQDVLQTHLPDEPETVSEFYRTMFTT